MSTSAVMPVPLFGTNAHILRLAFELVSHTVINMIIIKPTLVSHCGIFNTNQSSPLPRPSPYIDSCGESTALARLIYSPKPVINLCVGKTGTAGQRAQENVDKYQAGYAAQDSRRAFLPAVVSTSGRILLIQDSASLPGPGRAHRC